MILHSRNHRKCMILLVVLLLYVLRTAGNTLYGSYCKSSNETNYRKDPCRFSHWNCNATFDGWTTTSTRYRLRAFDNIQSQIIWNAFLSTFYSLVTSTFLQVTWTHNHFLLKCHQHRTHIDLAPLQWFQEICFYHYGSSIRSICQIRFFISWKQILFIEHFDGCQNKNMISLVTWPQKI